MPWICWRCGKPHSSEELKERLYCRRCGGGSPSKIFVRERPPTIKRVKAE